jgi:myosin heavy subunit
MAMQKTIVSLVFVFTCMQADELTRINALADEVKILRKNYEQCQKQLHTSQPPLVVTTPLKPQQNRHDLQTKNDHLKETNTQLQKELQKVRKQHNQLIKKLQQYSQQLKEYKKQLADAKAKTQACSKRLLAYKQQKKEKQKYKRKVTFFHTPQKTCTKEQRSLQKTQILLRKKELPKTYLALNANKEVRIIRAKDIYITPPTTYKTLKDANIYDATKTKVIQKWVKGVLFTSYAQTKEWVKITGYFIGNKWVEAKKEMWIRKTLIKKEPK